MNNDSEPTHPLRNYLPMNCYGSVSRQTEHSSDTNGPDGALTYPGTSRTMATALGSVTEDMRSMSEAPLQPSTLVPTFVTQSASNRITPCFDNHPYDEVDFTYDLDSHQMRRSTPSLSLLNDYLDHDPIVLSGLRSTAGPHSIETDWNHDNFEPCYRVENTSHVYDQANLNLLNNANPMQAASGPSQLTFRTRNEAFTHCDTSELPSAQYSASLVGTIHRSSETNKFTFRCTDASCRYHSFEQMNTFGRHYKEAHALNQAVFWCPLSDCDRSESGSKGPFKRKERMEDHALRKHDVQKGDAKPLSS